MPLKIFQCCLLLCFAATASAQSIGIGTNTPNSSAMLDISSASKGVLVPRMSSAQRTTITSPAKGLLVFDNDNNSFWFYDGSTWKSLLTYTEFISQNGIVRNTSNIAGDNFLFGSTRLDDSTGTTADNSRFFFNKTKGAFRAGQVSGENWNNDNIGIYSFSAGTETIAKGQFSTAIGQGSSATGQAATALGAITTASGWVSTALGGETKATANYTTAMGYKTLASGDYATALGNSNTASGNAAIAMGSNNISSGAASTAMGALNTASGSNSLASGFANATPGQGATAFGGGNNASGDFSFAAGTGIKTPSYGEVGIGNYNVNYTPAANGATQWNNPDRLFTIGNGTAENARNNALTVLKNGNVGIATDKPVSKLDVNGQLIIEQKNFGGYGGLLIKGYNASLNYPNIGFSVQNSSGNDVIAAIITGNIIGSAPGNEAIDLTFSTSYSGLNGLTEKMRITGFGSIAFSGNTGSTGQVLTSNGTNAAPAWTNLNRPYVVHFDLSSEVNITGSSQTYADIPGLNNRQFTLSQPSTVVFSYHATLGTNILGKPMGGTILKVVNSLSQTIMDRTVWFEFVSDRYMHSMFQTVLELPAGVYTTNARIYRFDPLAGELNLKNWSETKLTMQIYPN